MKLVEPTFGYDVDGYVYLGRGPGGSGWSRIKCYYYRCAGCGDMMCAATTDYFNCQCKAMHLDVDAGRFGSDFGDQNILRYQKIDPQTVESLMELWPGACIQVIQEFRDYDGKTWTVGTALRGFKEYTCVPYHGGYTFVFENETLRFCDAVPENVGVFSHFQQYFRVTETLSAPTDTGTQSADGAASNGSTIPAPPATLQKRAKILLWISSILMLFASPAFLVAFVMSIAAPGASLLNDLLLATLTALPYAVVIAGWIMYWKKNYRAADLCAKTPLVLGLIFFIGSTAVTIVYSLLGFPTLKGTVIQQPVPPR